MNITECTLRLYAIIVKSRWQEVTRGHFKVRLPTLTFRRALNLIWYRADRDAECKNQTKGESVKLKGLSLLLHPSIVKYLLQYVRSLS